MAWFITIVVSALLIYGSIIDLKAEAPIKYARISGTVFWCMVLLCTLLHIHSYIIVLAATAVSIFYTIRYIDGTKGGRRPNELALITLLDMAHKIIVAFAVARGRYGFALLATAVLYIIAMVTGVLIGVSDTKRKV